jgi:membrane protein DedA with SNARE-associated domain
LKRAPEKPQKKEPAKRSGALTNILRILALLAVIAITVYIYSIRDSVKQFATYGYPGIFLVTLMANATVFIPAPGVAVVYAMGSIFNPLGVGLAAGTGGALGELSGYLAGFSGQAVIENTKVYDRIHPWVEKFGGWTIFVLAVIPNPFFDIAGVAAGISKLPLRRFLLACWLGELIKMSAFAYAGFYSLDWLINKF